MKRIGVVIPAITDNLQTELLTGITAAAAEAGCDVILGVDAHAAAHILEKEAEASARNLLARYGVTPLEEVPLRRI